MYSDIVIMKTGSPTIVLELVVTAKVAQLEEHIEWALIYKALHSGAETWLIHFTCGDDVVENPYWPEKLENGFGIVHFWHDVNFNTVKMSICFKDEDNIQQIDKQLVTI